MAERDSLSDEHSTVNRRRVLQVLAPIAAGGLAGCGGDGGDATPTSTPAGGDTPGSTATPTPDEAELMQRPGLIFRHAWQDEPDYATGYAAQLEGFWAEAGVSPPQVQRGFGSGDTARRVGLGEDKIGMGAFGEQVVGLAEEGYDMSVWGATRTQSSIAILYREDSMDGIEDLEGKTMAKCCAIYDRLIPVFFEELGISQDDVDIQTAEDTAQYTLMAQGEIDASFTAVDHYSSFTSALDDNDIDVEIGVEKLYNHLQLLDYTNVVNTEWLAQEEDDGTNLEYMQRIAEGYSHALKWIMLNPEAAVEMMRQEVNQELQVEEKGVQVEALKGTLLSSNLTEEARTIGVGAIGEDAAAEALEIQATALDVEAPPVDDAFDFRIQEEADLATLSDDEFAEIEENAQPYASW